jgi:cephalosporin-C deacetylase-like acetyl esterase
MDMPLEYAIIQKNNEKKGILILSTLLNTLKITVTGYLFKRKIMNTKEISNCLVSNSYHDVKDQLKQHVYNRSEIAFTKGDADRDAIKSTQSLLARQKAMRKAFIQKIGGLPSFDTPLNPKIVGTIQQDGFRIEKVIFESRPKVFVTANLYIPNGITKRQGAVLFVCGHHQQAKHVDEYQIVCRYLVKAGLVVLAQDPIGQGERFSYHEKSINATTIRWGTLEHDFVGSQTLMVGDSLAKYFVHDAMRGIDYLISRQEVDPKQIGVTGNSGGGTQTSLVMCCDPRIAAAAPTTFIMNRQTYMHGGGAQDAEQIWPGMTALGFDHEDILLLACPKPVRVLAVTYDFFPIEGTRLTVNRCKRIWKLFGKPDCLDLVEDVHVHNYTRKLAKASAEFFSEHLLGRKVTPKDDEITNIEPSKLWCTASGQVRGEIPGAKSAFENNLERVNDLEKIRKSLSSEARRKNAVSWLKSKVFNSRKPVDHNLRVTYTMHHEGLSLETAFWWSQKEIINAGVMFKEFNGKDKPLPVTIAIWDDGTNALQSKMNWIRKVCRSGRAVLVLDVTGLGCLEPNPLNVMPVKEFYGVIHTLNDDLIWLDDSICAMRVFDVLRAVELIKLWPGVKSDDIRLYGDGKSSVYPQLAGLLDSKIKKIELGPDALRSYSEWVKDRQYDAYNIRSIVLPGMLNSFDLPEITGRNS